MQTLLTQQLLERLAGLLRGESRQLLAEYGLQPVQLEALYYLSISNRYSDTPMAVTEFLGQTKGTVSQTLKVLEKKALINKVPDIKDRRVTHLSVTRKGKHLLNKLRPSPMLARTHQQLPNHDQADIVAALTQLLRGLQAANNFKTFGQCATCVHNIRHNNGHYLCGLTQEPLSSHEVELICREHEFGQPTQPGVAG